MMKYVMLIILTIVLGSSFLSSADNALVENIEIEIVEKKSSLGDKLLDDPLDFVLLSSLLLLLKNIPIQHNSRVYYHPYETILTPFRPPCSFLTA